MKKLHKNISITFFSLLAVTFLLLFIYKFVSISVLSQAFEQSETSWSYIVLWFLEVGLSIAIFIMALLAIISLLSKKEIDEKKFVRKNCLYLAISSVVFIVGEMLSLINLLDIYKEISSSSATVSLAFPIIFIVFQSVGCIILFIAASKSENMAINKVFGVIGYITLFIDLIFVIISITNAMDAFLIILIFLFFFVVSIGTIHIVTCDVNYENNEAIQEKQNVEDIIETSLEQKSDTSMSELEQRLIYLKNLHAQNLITDKEYNDKRKQIIDSL